VGMIIFVGFIIYDTYMIVTRLGVDDYVIAAIELYLDMINMFMLILSCLTLCGGDNR
jgi:FtsH-binding integral membrane protein